MLIAMSSHRDIVSDIRLSPDPGSLLREFFSLLSPIGAFLAVRCLHVGFFTRLAKLPYEPLLKWSSIPHLAYGLTIAPIFRSMQYSVKFDKSYLELASISLIVFWENGWSGFSLVSRHGLFISE